jgi:hypothetical protein
MKWGVCPKCIDVYFGEVISNKMLILKYYLTYYEEDSHILNRTYFILQ